MTPEEIASALNARANDLGLQPSAIAAKCGLATRHVRDALRGAAASRVTTMTKVAEVLGLVAVVVPRPLAPVVQVPDEATEPRVVTRVQRALASLVRGRVVLFLDMDGVAHAFGDSRIDDRGALVGDNMFRWWPVLEGILEEHPEVEVVVHSSWRLYWPTVASLSALLPDALAARVTGITDPQIVDRHESIQKYLEQEPGVLSHVIVDDNPAAFPPGLPQLVLCDPDAGLGDPQVAERLRAALAEAAALSRSKVRGL